VELENSQPEAYPTGDVVVGFYQNWPKNKLSRAEAMRQAQLIVLHRGGPVGTRFNWGAWYPYGERR